MNVYWIMKVNQPPLDTAKQGTAKQLNVHILLKFSFALFINLSIAFDYFDLIELLTYRAIMKKSAKNFK